MRSDVQVVLLYNFHAKILHKYEIPSGTQHQRKLEI